MNTPNFFIVGAAKSGTTSLYNYLKQHEDVFMSPIKEPQYFGDDIHGESFGKFDALSYFKTSPLPEMHIANVNNWEDYQKLFAEGQERKAIGEASTAYLFSKSAAREIKSKIPQAKIIIILRNPIERAYSHYLMNIQGGISKQSFIDAINEDYEKKEKGWGVSNLYIEIGQYFQQIQRYFHEFPKDQIKILLFEDLINDQATLMEDIYSFLEIDKNYNADYSKQHLVSQSPRFNNSIYFPDYKQKTKR